tara:strand:+ start:462 stop:623 length:162 start_codon:yes stop_codon:yes gene_type:complete
MARENKRLSIKRKRAIRRRVDLELGIRPPSSRVHKSKKAYNRKDKHKRNHENE